MDKQSTIEVSSLYEKVTNFLQIQIKFSQAVYIFYILQKSCQLQQRNRRTKQFPKSLFKKNTQGVSLINHRNIANDMMFDNKHLNKDGFFTMLVIIKYVLFGFLPTTPRGNKYKDNYVSRTKYGRSNRR